MYCLSILKIQDYCVIGIFYLLESMVLLLEFVILFILQLCKINFTQSRSHSHCSIPMTNLVYLTIMYLLSDQLMSFQYLLTFQNIKNVTCYYNLFKETAGCVLDSRVSISSRGLRYILHYVQNSFFTHPDTSLMDTRNFFLWTRGGVDYLAPRVVKVKNIHLCGTVSSNRYWFCLGF